MLASLHTAHAILNTPPYQTGSSLLMPEAPTNLLERTVAHTCAHTHAYKHHYLQLTQTYTEQKHHHCCPAASLLKDREVQYLANSEVWS